MHSYLVNGIAKGRLSPVLILVLMEDALVHLVAQTLTLFRLTCLNPCFNGRCTRTMVGENGKFQRMGLNPCFNGRCTRTVQLKRITLPLWVVLILVLMEDALVRGLILHISTFI